MESLVEWKSDVDSRIKKVESAPVNLEEEILRETQKAISAAIAESLKGYGSPLLKLVTEVVNSRSETLRSIITTAFDGVISTDEFKQSIVSAFSHKVGRTIISNNQGLFDKVSNELKGDAVFKSKMALAVARVVEECLQGKEDASS
ncbi:MAG: hypothetical protein AAGH89_12690 [Verrucomicrobiota bacterium]